ncbi:hypothetical protein CROQUDRAFT_660577 [Cronartium quercuum f. sp. fusiforme G11]|uniref:C2H2-type domain-containing protein n=1 Tax=Cronartium quercuum f. sp. fusiforme G11 TaxID=708437 RepID=A0A9P6NGV5_9BASI|nr:hypothetical protein CROQUDRAFT_660577 [Cronartium quercuum f. sp. fusiforme G11]
MEMRSRKRTLDEISSGSESEEVNVEHFKLIRVEDYLTDKTTSSSNTPFTCSLSPTCHSPQHSPPTFSTAAQLESHHRTHHTHICSHHPTQLVFPDERFLNLHFRECHDPLLQLAREQGKKTFACFEYSCDRLFLTPKSRRLHLIDSHGYPSTFHFSLPNHGLTSLYQRYGPAVSLLRPKWSSSSHPSSPSSPSSILAQHISTYPKDQTQDSTCPMYIEPKNLPEPIPSIKISPSRPEPSPKIIPPEPTSAISLLSGFDRLSLVPRQVRLARVSSQSQSHQPSES